MLDAPSKHRFRYFCNAHMLKFARREAAKSTTMAAGWLDRFVNSCQLDVDILQRSASIWSPVEVCRIAEPDSI